METLLKSQGYGNFKFRGKGKWGSGGRWFKSSRPDQFLPVKAGIFNPLALEGVSFSPFSHEISPITPNHPHLLLLLFV